MAPLSDFETIETGDDIIDTTVTDVDWTALEVRNVTIKRSTFTRCRLSATAINDLLAVDTVFDDCVLSGADLHGARLQRVTFNRCKLDGANLRMIETTELILTECDLTGTDLLEAQLDGARVENCKLDGAVIERARVVDADLRTSDLTGLRGAASLRGAKVSPDQLIQLARTFASEIGVVVVDDEPDGDETDEARPRRR